MGVVYMDVFLLFNTAINYIILHLTARTARTHAGRGRILLSAVIGAAVAALPVLFPMTGPLWAILKILTALLMVAAAFGLPDPARFIRALFSFLAVTFVLGGSVFALYLFFGDGITFRFIGGSPYIYIPGLPMAALVAASCLIAAGAGRMLELRGRLVNFERTVALIRCGRTVTVRGYIDTGNLLTDTAGCPVVLALLGDTSGILTPEELIAAEAVIGGNAAELPAEIERIAYTAAGGGRGFFPAVRADRIEISDPSKGGGISVFERATVAFTHSLSVHGDASVLLQGAHAEK